MSKRDDYRRGLDQYKQLIRWLNRFEYMRIEFSEDRLAKSGVKITIAGQLRELSEGDPFTPTPDSSTIPTPSVLDAALREAAAAHLADLKQAAIDEAKSDLEELSK